MVKFRLNGPDRARGTVKFEMFEPEKSVNEIMDELYIQRDECRRGLISLKAFRFTLFRAEKIVRKASEPIVGDSETKILWQKMLREFREFSTQTEIGLA